MSNVSIAGYAGWPTYDTFLIVLLSGQPVYDPNPLRSNPNPKKPVSGSCRVRGLGRTLTPLVVVKALIQGDFELTLYSLLLNDVESVWIELILLKLKTENWKHCSKIIFKCVNSTVGLIFNEKLAEKWNLWVREQCICALFTVKKSTFAATV